MTTEKPEKPWQEIKAEATIVTATTLRELADALTKHLAAHPEHGDLPFRDEGSGFYDLAAQSVSLLWCGYDEQDDTYWIGPENVSEFPAERQYLEIETTRIEV